MKRRISTRVVCLLLAAIMLIGVLTVSAINGSPYENLKNAAFNALFYENFTVEGDFAIHVDGQLHDRVWFTGYLNEERDFVTGGMESPWRLELLYAHMQDMLQDMPMDIYRYITHDVLLELINEIPLDILQDIAGGMSLNDFQDVFLDLLDNLPDDMRQSLGMEELPDIQLDSLQLEHVSYSCQQFSIQLVNGGVGGTHWYQVRRLSQSHTRPRSLGHGMLDGAGRESNYLRLAELFLDVFVGDLKNNLVMTSQSDGSRRITGAITESQLPEFVRIMIDIAIEEQLRWGNTTGARDDFENILTIPMRSLVIDRIQGEAEVDADGNLIYANILGIATIENIFGDTHVVEVSGSVRFSDIGTTVPPSIFTDAAPIFEEAFQPHNNTSNDWSHWRTLYFTLDENGNVDADSFTDIWPRFALPARLRVLF